MTARPRLLVVDDEAEFSRTIRDAAEGCGYETESAPDGRTAQSITTGFNPDVVMVDMVMPDADGIDYIRWLVGSRFRGRLVLTSGYDPRYLEMAQIIARAGGILSVDILAKPVRLDRLEAILSRKP